jgi:hypothetical protein
MSIAEHMDVVIGVLVLLWGLVTTLIAKEWNRLGKDLCGIGDQFKLIVERLDKRDEDFYKLFLEFEKRIAHIEGQLRKD